MNAKLIEIVSSTNPKNLAPAIKKNPELYQWVQTHHGATLAEKAYNALYPNQNICEVGKQKKFNSINVGYRFCGVASVCECAKGAVSAKVTLAKSNVSPEDQKKANEKRIKTNVSKYGVTNVGITQKAKSEHKKFYSNPENIKKVNEKIQKTTLERYNVKNVGQVSSIKEKRKQSILAKYGVSNIQQLPCISSKSQKTKKEKYEPFYLAKLNYHKFIQTVEENFNVTPLITQIDYIGVGARPHIEFKCLKCNNTFCKKFDYASPPICKSCNPTEITYKSKEELELYNFCKSISPNVISGDRSRISPYEIDVYFPDYKIGIEYCGLYWHSELSGKKSWNYHYRKHQAALSQGIQLITIYSDEWLNSANVVKSLILNKLGFVNKSTYARKCILKKIASADAYNFYKINHLQDPPKRLPINYALFYKDQICAVMSFSKKLTGCYELTRFASDGRVMGGASKLLHAFIKEYAPKIISSFSNNRYSDGRLYKTLGFTIEGTVPPMQEYVFKYVTRLHKKGIGKHIAEIKANQTEWEAAQSIGCDRIWDCGKIKWVLRL